MEDEVQEIRSYEIPDGAGGFRIHPVSAADGRPYVLGEVLPALWMPSPPRHGDDVYCDGHRVGTFGGTWGQPGGWYVEVLATKDLPPEVVARARGLEG